MQTISELQKTCKMSALKTTKYCWEKLKRAEINRGVCHVPGLNSQYCQFIPDYSVDTLQPHQTLINICLVLDNINKLILTLIWKCKEPKITKPVFKKKKICEHSYHQKPNSPQVTVLRQRAALASGEPSRWGQKQTSMYSHLICEWIFTETQ